MVQLQLLAAATATATAINLKRLLDHGHAAQHGQTGDPAVRHAAQHGQIAHPTLRHAAIRVLTRILIDTLIEIDRLTATDLSTGS